MLPDAVQIARIELSNLCGVIEGVNSVALAASRNIQIASTTRDTTSSQGKCTAINRVAGLYITGSDGALTASAGRDLNIDDAAIVNGLLASNPTAATSSTLLAADHRRSQSHPG